MCVCREIEYLKKETAQRRAQEESETTHKEEAENLQDKVSLFHHQFDPKVCAAQTSVPVTVFCL